MDAEQFTQDLDTRWDRIARLAEARSKVVEAAKACTRVSVDPPQTLADLMQAADDLIALETGQ